MMFNSIIQTTRDLRKAQARQSAFNDAKLCERFFFMKEPRGGENHSLFGHYYREAGRIYLRMKAAQER